jgi:serine phosphatase RsbU (regulator of sigma subunit)
VIKRHAGDIVVLHTDGVSDTTPAGDELGRDGLMTIARELDRSSAETFGSQLTSALGSFRAGVEPNDDATFIVLHG